MLFNKDKLLIVAGPCAVESEAICRQVADVLTQIQKRTPEVQIIFKSSFDKANRISAQSARGLGKDTGLQILSRIKADYGFPILTDIHESHQASAIASVADVLQIPAFLCRQTDLLLAAAATGKVVNIKNGQFLAPTDMQYLVQKLNTQPGAEVWQTERGTTFGYGNLVVDMKAFPIMKANQTPVLLDATHCVQLPGAAKGQSGGEPQFTPTIAHAALAAGADGLYIETHPDPKSAISDRDIQVPLQQFEALIQSCLIFWKAYRSLA